MQTVPLLQLGLVQHQQGMLREAEQSYRSVLSSEPNQADALHLLGVVQHQIGRHQEAVELIDRAISVNSQVPSFYCNLSDAHRSLGNFEAGVEAAERAILLKPDYYEARNNLGVLFFSEQRWSEAEVEFRRALELRQRDPRAHCHLGDALREQGKVRAAVACYEQAIEIKPDFSRAHINIGPLLLMLGEPLRAVDHCRKAVEGEPTSVDAQTNLGKCLRDTDQFEEAIEVYSRAVEIDSESSVLCTNIGEAWQEMGHFAEATLWYERALRTSPESLHTKCHLASVRRDMELLDQSIADYREVLELDPQYVQAHAGLAQSLWEMGDAKQAIESLQEAARLRPEWARVHANLGQILASAGDLDAAIASHREAIGRNERSIAGWAGLAITLRDKLPDDEVAKIQSLLAEQWLSKSRRAALYFGLAQVFDGRTAYAQAADYVVEANRLQKAHWKERNKAYDPQAYSQFIDRLTRVFTPEYFRRVEGWGLKTERPVFVVGMPRSGTTLIEQILASHPNVYGAGERRIAHEGFQQLSKGSGGDRQPVDCVEDQDRQSVEELAQAHLQKLDRLDGGATERITDKLPDNYNLVGFIHTLFPKARIIHCRRDPRDVALSCWITNFAQIVWATDLQHIANRIIEHQRVMAHWRSVLPDVILDVDYEETVSDLPAVARRLIGHLDLPWNDACLDFQKTSRLVRTASVNQVRQPVYTRSVGRWRHYEDMLRPLFDKLEDSDIR